MPVLGQPTLRRGYSWPLNLTRVRLPHKTWTTAGVAAGLDERVTLDLAWRYTDFGEVRTGQGAGRVVWRDGSREPLPLDLAPTRAKLAGHGVRLSLRYAF